MAMAARTEVVPLVQQMIRNACVNDGTDDSGHESRNADLLRSVLEGPGLDLQAFELRPGRSNLVARISGNDPTAPSMLWLGHIDVVPVHEEAWTRDPFGGELVDGEVWGRGAIDMFNLTASMAIAVRCLADAGFRPRGDLIFAAVADEEDGGDHGARFLAERHLDAIRCDYAITEAGGMPIPTAAGLALPVLVGERGTLGSHLVVNGSAGHGSLPYGVDNAVITAAEVVRRITALRVPLRITPAWRGFLDGLGVPAEVAELLTDPGRIDEALSLLPPGLAKMAHSCTRTTLTPTGIAAGLKRNVIPDQVEISLDIRTMPGDDRATVKALLLEAVGDLADRVELHLGDEIPATASPQDTPLWDSLTRVARGFYPDGHLVPMLSPGGTDNRWLRPTGAVGYGFGLFSRKLGLEELAAMAHGHNERVDVESLHLATDMWSALAHDVLA